MDNLHKAKKKAQISSFLLITMAVISYITGIAIILVTRNYINASMYFVIGLFLLLSARQQDIIKSLINQSL